ncbi:alanine aminotransferase 1 [Eurytemora carolleeae]|uniref:alanine aminotransferase 1 n=1 Tax=Eurytemora carolleeae TaxID=1294199 RepID=UPI000C77E154|nr:alanine aminotransferase 1 [Eurytemora carolleeae]|eukprot:XP_023332769.1 alanine aminotransferase 1-like [Eurytemora affinis]
MDPSNFQSMKHLKLCESSSCTDLPGLDTGDLDSPDFNGVEESGSDSEGRSDEDILTMKPVESKVLTVDMVNEGIKVMTYAVRGPLLIRANEIEQELKQGVEKSFKTVIKANIGDAHAMGNKPITFIRQVMAIVTCPSLLESEFFPEDAKLRAREILAGCRGGSVGAYSDSPGIEIIRRHVAQYITERDGGIPADWRNIMLSSGASEAIRAILKLMTNPGIVCQKKPGVMVPIPQYPLYSATLAEYGMEKVGYYLDESKGWALSSSELERSIREAKKRCTVRAIVVINPGNPTGQVLSRKNIESIIKFAHKEKLFLLADEVYQHNIYSPESKFYSFKKVMMEMGHPYSSLELVSFMSCSKGYMGECGVRGGYADIINMDPDVMGMLQKSISAKLCPPILGQACLDLVVHHPQPQDPSYSNWTSEVQKTLNSFAKRAEMVANILNGIEGMRCNVVQGAMYAFPRVMLPERAIEAAREVGQTPDVFYAFNLLEETGVCVIPGSGFGQEPGTYHFRTTILPQESVLMDMLDRIKRFHVQFMKKFSDN